jgi:hypothetical protein
METIKELKELVSLFKHRKLSTNDSIIMVGDLEKLEKLIKELEEENKNLQELLLIYQKKCYPIK